MMAQFEARLRNELQAQQQRYEQQIASIPRGGGRRKGCFSGTSKVNIAEVSSQMSLTLQVELTSGKIKISDLKLGDKVKTLNSNGEPLFTEFLGWLDRDSSAG